MALARSALRSPAVRSQRDLRGAVLLAALAMLAGVGCASAGQLQAGLRAGANAWSATVAALHAYPALHPVVLPVMAGYRWTRSARARPQPRARATLDNVWLMGHFVTAVGVATLAVVHGPPAWLA